MNIQSNFEQHLPLIEGDHRNQRIAMIAIFDYGVMGDLKTLELTTHTSSFSL